ncbi:MAG TPA: GNAT family N-acetyltransferase [Solimonas sp.]|nr:GNAT family N-acetyltransferase [Solimonas sp.]
MDYELIEINDPAGGIAQPAWLARAEGVHRQLRPQLPAGYVPKMQRVFAGGGRMTVAAQGDEVRGVAVWRVHENTFAGVQMYVDDLVTDAAQRSRGGGHALMQWLEARARSLGCAVLCLDSGTQRRQAHKFYFREGLPITAFHFSREL